PGRLRTYAVSGTRVEVSSAVDDGVQLLGGDRPEPSTAKTFLGYDRLPDGVRVRWRGEFAGASVDVTETLRIQSEGGRRRLVRDYASAGVPAGRSLQPAHLTFELPPPRSPATLERAAL